MMRTNDVGAARVGRRGFTLIEILCVVVILGIAGAIIVPQISSRDDLTASSAARALMADLIYAQNMSITRQTAYCVKFDITGKTHAVVTSPTMAAITHPVTKGTYLSTYGSGGSTGLTQVTLTSASFVGQSTGTAYTIIGFDELGTPIAYKSDGTSETMASGAIVLTAGSYSLEVDIEPYTGQISVKTLP